jgi:hypothetical protein
VRRRAGCARFSHELRLGEFISPTCLCFAATNAPVNVATFKMQLKELQDKNVNLQERVHKLEKMIRERNIRIERGGIKTEQEGKKVEG